MEPVWDALVEIAARTIPPDARVIDIGGPPAPPAMLAGRRVLPARTEEALAILTAHEADPIDVVLAAWPTRELPLMRLLEATHRALRPDGRALIADLVWQTAPTPELLRAFARAPGRDKVRPIEGYEMQAQHAGFAIDERASVPVAHWAPALPPDARAAVDADTRGAARLAVWVLRPTGDD